MDTLRERLASLAEVAPRGGAPASELWSRGKRAHRHRAAAMIVGILAIASVGAGVGNHLSKRPDASTPTKPAEGLGFTLPLNYMPRNPPKLGPAPGPLAALWVIPRSGEVPEVVALVAKSGKFGLLSLDLARDNSEATGETTTWDVALSPDGRRVAYLSPPRVLVVHDLVTGDDIRPDVDTRPGFGWADATHLFGHDGKRGGDADGWVWQPGTAPRLVDYYAFTLQLPLVPSDEPHLSVRPDCSTTPAVTDTSGKFGTKDPQGYGSLFQVPQMCDVIGVVGTHTLLGHDTLDEVIALDVHDGPPFDDPALRQVVIIQGAPERVTLATDLIGQALAAQGGGS